MLNIYLIGMMGSGKSVTGKALADRLEYSFVDLDAEIEKKEGRTITEIFAQEGEPYFRDVETAVLKEFSKKKKHVFATGGGIVLKPENVQCMNETGKPILLKTSAKELLRRLKYSTDRPLLNKPDPEGAVRQILEDREPCYEEAAYLSVDTDGKIAEDVASEIQEALKPKP